MSATEEIEVGKTYSVECPFVRDVYYDADEDGSFSALSWKPGIVWQGNGDYADARAHGMGRVSYTVIAISEMPRPYPKRVFFTRQWSPPEGRPFGKNRLIVMTSGQFKRRIRSYIPAGCDRWTELIVADMTPDERARALGK